MGAPHMMTRTLLLVMTATALCLSTAAAPSDSPPLSAPTPTTAAVAPSDAPPLSDPTPTTVAAAPSDAPPLSDPTPATTPDAPPLSEPTPAIAADAPSNAPPLSDPTPATNPDAPPLSDPTPATAADAPSDAPPLSDPTPAITPDAPPLSDPTPAIAADAPSNAPPLSDPTPATNPDAPPLSDPTPATAADAPSDAPPLSEPIPAIAADAPSNAPPLSDPTPATTPDAPPLSDPTPATAAEAPSDAPPLSDPTPATAADAPSDAPPLSDPTPATTVDVALPDVPLELDQINSTSAATSINGLSTPHPTPATTDLATDPTPATITVSSDSKPALVQTIATTAAASTGAQDQTNASTTVVEPSDALRTPAPSPATTIGSETFNPESIIGKWWTYYRNKNNSTYESLELEITKTTPEEIAEVKELRMRRNSTSEDRLSDEVSWQHVSFSCKFKGKRDDGSTVVRSYLIESLTTPSHIKAIGIEGGIGLYRVKFTDGVLSFRADDSFGFQFHFYRTLPDLATFARCDGFDSYSAGEVFDADSLEGTWTATPKAKQSTYTLKVSRKTVEEVASFKDALKNTTVEEADIDWTKVHLGAELFKNDDFVAHGLIEVLNKTGSVRVIPLKDMWDKFPTKKVDDWFTSQNHYIKKVDGLLGIQNCGHYWQHVYMSRRPETRRRKLPWKRVVKTSGRKKNYF